MSSAIIILAAGSSSRLGKPKQLIKINDESLLQRIINVAQKSTAKTIIVVLGSHYELISQEIITGENVHVIINTDWNEGISYSIKTAIKFLQESDPDIESAIITLCDQPFITSYLLDELINVCDQTKKAIVASSYANTLGTPALFTRKMFSQLMELQGDNGAKKIIMLHKNETARVCFPLGNIDIDTEEDYNNLSETE